jgi:transcriptional regulator with XRE-family HTH domain
MTLLAGAIFRLDRRSGRGRQEALADAAGLHRTYVSLLERGLRTPSFEVVRQLAGGLGTTMASLVGELEKECPSRRKKST